MTRHHSCRVSPFGHPRIHARLTAPRGLSQPPTSFIGSQCQGIHHALLNTYKHKNQKKNQKLHHNKPHTQPPPRRVRTVVRPDARNHYPQIKHHTPPPRWSDNRNPQPGNQRFPPGAGTHPTGSMPRACCLRTQQCVWQHPPSTFPSSELLCLLLHPLPTHYR